MIRYPNGYIIETDPPENAFFVYGELNAAGYIAKGFRLDVPNLSNAGWPQEDSGKIRIRYGAFGECAVLS